jgi:hypothetical protein
LAFGRVIGLTVKGPPLETVTVVVPDTLPSVAVITLVPAATPVTTPALLTVATPGVPELHVTCELRFCVPPPA